MVKSGRKCTNTTSDNLYYTLHYSGLRKKKWSIIDLQSHKPTKYITVLKIINISYLHCATKTHRMQYIKSANNDTFPQSYRNTRPQVGQYRILTTWPWFPKRPVHILVTDYGNLVFAFCQSSLNLCYPWIPILSELFMRWDISDIGGLVKKNHFINARMS